MQWYYAKNGQQQGPVEQEELVRMAHEEQLAPGDLVWNPSMGDQWRPAREMPELFPPTERPAPFVPGATAARRAANAGQTPNSELAARARAGLGGRWGLAVGFTVVLILVMMAGSIITGFLPGGSLLFQLLVTGPITVGMSIFFLAVSRRGEPAMGQMFAGFQRFGPAVGAYLLVSLFIFLWMMLVTVPGFILVLLAGFGPQFFSALARGGVDSAGPPNMPVFVALLTVLVVVATVVNVVVWLRYSMTFFVIADDPNAGPMQAIRRSVDMMRGRKGKLFLLFLRFIGWWILAALTCGIGYLWVWPYVMTSWACFYDDLVAEG